MNSLTGKRSSRKCKKWNWSVCHDFCNKKCAKYYKITNPIFDLHEKNDLKLKSEALKKIRMKLKLKIQDF